jgi:putative DNA primase/helicase
VLRPRLEAAGADLARVHALKSVLARDQEGKPHPTVFSLQYDLDLLGEHIAALGDVSLVIIDPITAYFGDKVDTHKTAAVRTVLAQLDGFANRYDVAVLGITHPPKMIPGARAINAITGSLAFIAAARMAFIVIEEVGTDRRLLLQVKNNLGAISPGLAYRIKETILPSDIVSSYLCWDSDPVEVTAQEALAAANEAAKKHSDAMKEAKDFLLDLLAGGPVPAEEGKEKAEAAGISDRTLARARKRLGVIAEKDIVFQGRWMWRLP